nr:MAG TPA: Photosystem II repair protein PSB27-H1 protein, PHOTOSYNTHESIS.85A [Caudoviricetes sp.]
MKTWLKRLSVKLKITKEVIEREKDMMAKLFAINIVAGYYPFAKVPKVLKPKVKEQIALMVEDDELLAQLTKE